MNFRKTFLSVVAVATISSAAFGAGLAPNNSRGNPSDPGGMVKTRTAVFQWAAESNALPTNFAKHPVGSALHLHCGASAGCVVFVQTTMEIASGSSGDEWLICAKVDGHAMDPTECFNGLTRSTDINEGVYNGTLQVKKGDHTIKFFVETSGAATLFQWHEAAQMLQ